MSYNQVIPAEAVEAAACEAFFVDDIGGHIRGRYTWDTIPEDGRENYRKLVRAALEAAAPHMLAEAWDAGAEEQAKCYGMDKDTGPNPYRTAK